MSYRTLEVGALCYTTDVKKILFLNPPGCLTWSRIIEGAYAFSRKRDWMFQIQEHPTSAAEARKCLGLWKPDGCIVDCGHGYGYLSSCFRSVPTVYLNLPPSKSSARFFNVHEDTRRVCDAALDHLLSLECDHYAFVTYSQKARWADLRLQLFRKRMNAEARPYTVISPAEAVDPRVIERLPARCGILGCNDRMAQYVLQSALMTSRSIPDDISVMGIDNDTLICEAQSPALTSVEIDLRQAGYKLGALLAKVMDDPSAPPQTEFYGPTCVLRRESTRILRQPSVRIRTAMAFIRENACNRRLLVEDVAKVLGCSRTRAITMFRAATGKSILEEINDARFEQACRLLRNTTLPISAVVASCGYDSSSFFKRTFKCKTGLTMRDYRQAPSRTL